MTLQNPEKTQATVEQLTETEALLKEAAEAPREDIDTEAVPAAHPGANEGISP